MCVFGREPKRAQCTDPETVTETSFAVRLREARARGFSPLSMSSQFAGIRVELVQVDNIMMTDLRAFGRVQTEIKDSEPAKSVERVFARRFRFARVSHRLSAEHNAEPFVFHK